ncbi:hypothetical protein ACLOJK_030702 [Asimina triloba]
MATKDKDSHNCRKEKSRLSLSSPQTIDIYYIGKDQDPLIVIEKPAPNYLRPTLSFANEVCCRYAHRHAPEVAIPKGLSTRKFRQKHPPASELRKSPVLREKLAISSSSPKFSFERTLRKPRNGSIQHPERTKKLKKKAGPSAAAGNLGYNPKLAASSSDHHRKDQRLSREVVVEMLRSTDSDQVVLELPPAQFRELCELVESEMHEIHDGETEDLEKVAELSVEENVREGPACSEYGRTGRGSEESIDVDGEDVMNREVIIQDLTIVAAPTSGDEEKAAKVKLLRGKVVVDSAESEAVRCERLKFKVREVVDSGDESPNQENLLLKHQEVQARRESLASNDVIEETASKLVEERKSMVQALVGAFETVILLQESEVQSPMAMDPESRDSLTGSPVEMGPARMGPAFTTDSAIERES